ncbi:putative sodium bile acid cotransporter protein [Corchorus olitorius]|uniref:Sodium bile acid cotransporter protein n=1 Tax=Corchorus olitorius TaxID=93759 RepID=A0A1R3I919_9ROSI|nr:putative sodium bile acid cotransporter protein [Corchorus olitorius]
MILIEPNAANLVLLKVQTDHCWPGAVDTSEQVKVTTSDVVTVNFVDFNENLLKLLHLILLAFNSLALRSLSAVTGGNKSVFAKKENAQAALLVASQKTLPVMVAVVEQLRGAFGESGLLVLPCVAAHLLQIIMDSFLVNFWLRKDLPSNTAKVA